MKKKITIALFIAFLIRLISINQSLWLDEATTARVVLQYHYFDIVTKFSVFDFHPPLYYLFMKIWTSIFGYSEIILRLPSVLFSLLAGWIIYKIGLILKNNETGFWAMLFFLFNPLIMYYSQEARMYMMATFFLSTSLYFLVKILQVKNEKLKIKNYDLILFNIFNILSFYTFYGSIFFICAMIIILILKKNYRSLMYSFLFIIVASLPLIPLLYTQFNHSRQALLYVTRWNLALGKATLKNLLLIPLKFTSGRISFYPKILYFFVTSGWGLVVSYFVLKGSFKNKFFVILLLTPLLFGFIFSFVSPLLQYFRFIYCIVPLCILLEIGIRKSERKILLIGFLMFSLAYLILPQFHREDWKSMAKSLANEHVAYMIVPSSDPLKYYDPMLILRDIRTLDGIELEKRAVVIPYTTDIYGFDYKSALMKHGFTYKETKNFRGLWYEIWVSNKGYALR